MLFAAAAVRLWRVDLAQIGYDESAAASLAIGWRLNGAFPLTGIVSSVGIPNPPAWPYLMLPVLWMNPAPGALVLEGIVVGVASVALTWWVARRWLGLWPAIAAAAMYGFAFWSTMLGRSPWQPAFLQLPALLCLDALLVLGVRRRPWALAIACGWLGVMVQLHYVTLAYALVVPFAAWPARRVLRLEHLGTAALLAVLPLLPFLIYEVHPSIGFHDVSFLIGQGGTASRVDFSAFSLLWTLAGNGGAAGLGGADSSTLRDALGRWSSLGLLGDVLLVGGLVVAVFDGARGRIVAAWLLVPAALLIRHSLDVLFHYLYIDLPAVALCAGLLVSWASRRPPVLAAVAGALAVFVAASIATVVVVLDFVGAHDVYLGYGTPVRLSLAAADAARHELIPGATLAIGGPRFQTEVLQFAIGYDNPALRFDACPPASPLADVYLLLDEKAPASIELQNAGAPLLARVERPGGAYLVLGRPTEPLTQPC